MTKVEYLRCQTCAMRWRRIGSDLKLETLCADPCDDCVSIIRQYKVWSRRRYTVNAAIDEPIKVHSAIMQEVTQ